ncbi:MAG TPA: hypothetical protein DIT65_01920 [Cryomorphaceae bacterium]|nr:hypothetical protein [Cryomorphaceae bacterium]|tara:strand:+ start:2680 stop:3888 length:1209 start_codon:yes stop_codon:yes gene_type:complete
MTKTHSYLHITGGIGAALLPFAFPWLSPVYGLIIMALGTLAAGRKNFRFAPLLLFTVFIDWQWLSTTWSEHSIEGWGDVIMVLPITVMGILMHTIALDEHQNWVKRWMETFAWATLAAWTFIFCKSLYLNGWVSYKEFELGGRLGVHFQSLYLIAAALILERKIWRKTYGLSLLRAGAVLWLLFGVIVLSVRIHLIIVPIIATIRFWELSYKNKKNWKKILGVGSLALALGALLITTLPGPRERLIDLRNEIRSIDGKVDGKQTNHRIFIWGEGIKIITEHPVVGLGNGAGEFELNERLGELEVYFYRGKEAYTLDEFMYDFHNIWIQSWVESGLVAVLLLAAIFLWGLFKSKGVLRYIWLLLILTGTTESLLDKQAGALLIAFIVGLTALQSLKKRREPLS